MTQRRVLTTRRSDEDITNALAYYLHEDADVAALGLVEALDDARSLLSEHPSIGSPRFALETGIQELRSLVLKRFPYALFYTDDGDAIRIHRVLHTSRDIPAELG